MMAKTTRAVIYSRNSSKKQKSIDDQAAENAAACEANGWRLVEALSDPTSASRYATRVRKNWARLLELLPETDVVVLWEPSRGDRSLASWASFLDSCREHKVRIHAVTHARTYDPRVARDYRSLAEDGVDSAYESDKISARVLRGQASAATAGRPHGVQTYGYTRRYDQVTKAFVGQYEQPEHAGVVRDILGSVAAGEPVSHVCARLTRAGVPTAKGAAVWYASSLKAIITNVAYRPHPDDPARGCRVHDGQLYPAQWPPLVDELTWQAAQRAIGAGDKDARQTRRHSAPGKVKYLLSGRADLMSAPCGSKLDGWRTVTGRAGHYACNADRCVSCPMAEADEFVSRLVVARLSRRDARDLWMADDTATRQSVDELARLRRELKEARLSFAVPGGISATALALKETAMLPAIEDAKRRSRPAGAPLAALKLIEAGRIAKDRVRPTWDGFPVAGRREIIAGVFSSLVLGPITERITRWTLPEERLAIVGERIEHHWRTP